MIYFVPGLEKQVKDVLETARDCIDAANDLNTIECVLKFGTDEQAIQLDHELQEKYPAIKMMLNATNSVPVRYSRQPAQLNGESPAKSNLYQDKWGIICDVAVKKGIKESIQACIEYVEKSP